MLTDHPLSPALDAAELAYLAVTSKTGPMVTPVLFASKDERVWMVFPRASAKIAAIGRNAVVGATVTSPAGTAVLQGEARIVDLLDPSSLASSLPETLLSPRALGSYLLGNARHLPDLVGSAAPKARAMAAVRPARALLIGETSDVWSTGDWANGSGLSGDEAPEDNAALDLDGVPAPLRSAADRPGEVIVGWTTPTGPVALPGIWDPARRRASVRLEVFHAAGASARGAACVLFDLTEGTALDAKAGVVLRGRATAHAGEDETVDIALRVERVTWWQGDRSDSVATPER